MSKDARGNIVVPGEYRVVGVSGYAFADKVVTVTSSDLYGCGGVVCQARTSDGKYHIIKSDWIVPVAKVCGCCGQTIKEA